MGSNLTIIDNITYHVLDRKRILLLLVVEIIFITLLLIVPQDTLKLIISLPAIFIIPGFLLILTFSRDNSAVNILDLISDSFMISPLLLALLTLSLASVASPLNQPIIAVTIILFASTLAIRNIIRRRSVTLTISKADLTHLVISLTLFIFVAFVFSFFAHFPTPDENGYISNARYLLLNGKLLPVGSQLWHNRLMDLIFGRTLWILFIASFIGATGISSFLSNTINIVFLFGLVLVAARLIPSNVKDIILIRIMISVLIFFNPILLLLSGFALNDVAIAFYNVLSLAYFVDSFKKMNNKATIRTDYLIIAFLIQAIILLIKFNIIFLLPFYITFISYVLWHRLYQIRKYKLLLLRLFSPIIIYEMFVDVPRSISIYVLRNPSMSAFFGKFCIISPLEKLILLFVQPPWIPLMSNLKTLFNTGFIDHLLLIYKIFSPENLSLFIVSAFLVLPLSIKTKLFDEKTKIILTVTLLATIVMYFDTLISANLISVPRYYLSIVPPTVILAVTYFFSSICKHSPTLKLAPLIPILLLIGINVILVKEFGGVAASWLIPLMNTTTLLVIQALIYISWLIVISTQFLQRVMHKSLHIKLNYIRRVHVRVPIQVLTLIALMLAPLASNVYFSMRSLNESTYTKDYGLLDASQNLNPSNFVITNTYALPTFLPNDMLLNGFVGTFPSANKLNFLIENMPNGSNFVVFDNPEVTWLNENFVGDYIRTKVGSEIIQGNIPSFTYDKKAIFYMNFMEGKSDIYINQVQTVATFHNVTWIKQNNYSLPYLNGLDSYIEIKSSPQLNLSGSFTIEAWVYYEEGQKYIAPIVDYSTYNKGGYALFIQAPSRAIDFCGGFNKDAVTKNLKVPISSFAHIVVVHNLNHTTFYLNGEKETVNCSVINYISNSHSLLIGKSYWAFDGLSYFKGIIGGISIYNNTFKEDEIRNRYYTSIKQLPYLELSKTIISPDGKVFLYVLHSDRMLKNISNKLEISSLSWDVVENNTADVYLNLDVIAKEDCKIAIILSTDAFADAYSMELRPGDNIVSIPIRRFIVSNGNLLTYGTLLAGGSKIMILVNGTMIAFNGITSINEYDNVELSLYYLIIIFLLLFFLKMLQLKEGINYTQ